MNYFKMLTLGVVFVILGACTQANTVGPETTKELDNNFTNASNGVFVVYSPVSVTYTSADKSDVTAKNDPTQTISPNTSLSSAGATSSLATEGGSLILDGIKSIMDNRVDTVEPSDTTKKAIEASIPIIEHPVVEVGDIVETLSYHGRHNGDRPTWYGSKKLTEYPLTLKVSIDGCVDRVITHNGFRYESDGMILKNSDVAGRGLALVYQSDCKSKVATLTY